jgi:hypothetical protein
LVYFSSLLKMHGQETNYLQIFTWAVTADCNSLSHNKTLTHFFSKLFIIFHIYLYNLTLLYIPTIPPLFNYLILFYICLFFVFWSGWPSPFGFSCQDTNSASSFNSCIFRKTFGPSLSSNTVQFVIPTLVCTVGPRSMLIHIPHLDGNILVLHQLLDILTEEIRLISHYMRAWGSVVVKALRC